MVVREWLNATGLQPQLQIRSASPRSICLISFLAELMITEQPDCGDKCGSQLPIVKKSGQDRDGLDLLSCQYHQ